MSRLVSNALDGLADIQVNNLQEQVTLCLFVWEENTNM